MGFSNILSSVNFSPLLSSERAAMEPSLLDVQLDIGATRLAWDEYFFWLSNLDSNNPIRLLVFQILFSIYQTDRQIYLS